MPVAVVLALLFNRSALEQARVAPSAAPPASSGPASAPLPPVGVEAPPSSAAAQRSCPALVAALPVRLRELAARPVDSSSPYVVAWGEPPVVLRCGVPRPAGFVAGAPNIVAVNGVTWFAEQRSDRTVWTVVDRPVYVEVVVPARYSSGPVPPLSDAVKASLRASPLRPGR